MYNLHNAILNYYKPDRRSKSYNILMQLMFSDNNGNDYEYSDPQDRFFRPMKDYLKLIDKWHGGVGNYSWYYGKHSNSDIEPSILGINGIEGMALALGVIAGAWFMQNEGLIVRDLLPEASKIPVLDDKPTLA